MIRIVYIVLFFVLFIWGVVYAEPVAVQGNILQDEEGFALRNPVCVIAGPERDEIYVIASGAIHVYMADMFPLFTLSKGNGIEAALAMAFDSEGNFYVIQGPTKENDKPRISVFNRALIWERDIYFDGFPGAASFSPHRLAVDKKGNIYVTGNSTPDAIILDENGGFIDMISPMEEGRSVSLNDVVVDASGRMYLLSDQASHVYVYTEDRKLLFKFGQGGGVSGKLSRPRGVGVDVRRGMIYIVDYMRHTVTVYNYADGVFRFEFGGMGWGEGWLQYPNDIDVDSAGRVIVADTFNDRVEIFKPGNLELGVTSSGGEEANGGG